MCACLGFCSAVIAGETQCFWCAFPRLRRPLDAALDLPIRSVPHFHHISFRNRKWTVYIPSHEGYFPERFRHALSAAKSAGLFHHNQLPWAVETWRCSIPPCCTSRVFLGYLAGCGFGYRPRSRGVGLSISSTPKFARST